MTTADMIRSMTDEELAWFLTQTKLKAVEKTAKKCGFRFEPKEKNLQKGYREVLASLKKESRIEV